MKNNLQYLIKWCHSMGYLPRIGHNIISIRYKGKCKIENITHINNMNKRSLLIRLKEIEQYMMEDKYEK